MAGGKTARNNGRDFVAIRFHVHPEINLFTDKEDRLVLTANGTDAWAFSASVEPMVEDSIFFAGLSGPRKSRQIVLAFKASEVQEVRWQMTRTRLAEAAKPFDSQPLVLGPPGWDLSSCYLDGISAQDFKPNHITIQSLPVWL